jgi:hypothetical protein
MNRLRQDLNRTVFTVKGINKKWRAVDVGIVEERVPQASRTIQTRYRGAEIAGVVAVPLTGTARRARAGLENERHNCPHLPATTDEITAAFPGGLILGR